MKKNLVLLGMMGVGKSTLGKIVAKKLNLKFIDTDLNIEKKCSMKIWEIFKNKGEDFFRTEEQKEVIECLKKDKTVIALGGGAFLNKNIRNFHRTFFFNILVSINKLQVLFFSHYFPQGGFTNTHHSQQN